MKYCTECRWLLDLRRYHSGYGQDGVPYINEEGDMLCGRPREVIQDPVRGQIKPGARRCDIERYGDSGVKYCGENARYWESKAEHDAELHRQRVAEAIERQKKEAESAPWWARR